MISSLGRKLPNRGSSLVAICSELGPGLTHPVPKQALVFVGHGSEGQTHAHESAVAPHRSYLGLGPDACHVRNPALVYGRMTGWGQSGPYALMAGHDINYLSLTGALQAMGPANKPPFPPLNLVGDFGGGSLFLAMGILAALLGVITTLDQTVLRNAQ